MCQHEDKNCPRCQATFECKVGTILICQCTAVSLSDAERVQIYEKYDDCLCASCLKELKTAITNL